MAVQKSRVTKSRRGMRRSHNALTNPTLSSDKTTGEKHMYHNATKMSKDTGCHYRGRQIKAPKPIKDSDSDNKE